MRHSEFIIRRALKSDLEIIHQLEEKVWRADGTALTKETLESWFDLDSPLFLVAEYDGSVCGYYFAYPIQFSWNAIDDFAVSVSGKENPGDICLPLESGSSTVYGVSAISTISGAGSALNAEVRSLWLVLGIRYSIGFTRLTGLNDYLLSVVNEDGALPYSEFDIAAWYLQQSARMLGLRLHSTYPSLPRMVLPAIPEPDRLLKFHARGNPLTILRLVPGFMPDAASRGYAGLMAVDTDDFAR